MPEPEMIRLPADGKLAPEVIQRAADAARDGRIVAFPTDTVYGLGSSALSRAGVDRLYRMKGRRPDKPLPLLVASAAEAKRWVQWTPQAEALSRRFWPGGLTLVLTANAAGRGLAAAMGPTLALRVPDLPILQDLLSASAVPWASTSANAADQPPLPDGQAVAAAFSGDVAFVLDGGPSAGPPSSVLDLSAPEPRVLREGRIPSAELLAAAARPSKVLFVCTGNTCRSVMAGFLCEKLARARGWDLSARSCGIAAAIGAPMPAGVRAALALEGISDPEHAPRSVDAELMAWADVVLTMERRQRDALISAHPGFRAKIHALKDFAARTEAADIADPVGQPDSVYIGCCHELKSELEAILNNYAPTTKDPRP
ncbi:MAG: L-threonylcarbamoyladenylate synthase [Elusimicrobiota bacterium]|jgi:tRNA threonylcarbamoyl adenosine modification protein (Sua5/YciO/YrdC/YwlC family)